MNNTDNFSTDFLFTTPTFLTGAATIFNLNGNFYDYNESGSGREADCMALGNDFDIIGNDLKKAIETNNNSK
jgi:hypothetical protein